jgi:WD40 repeat protein
MSPIRSADLDADGDIDRFTGFTDSYRIVWQEIQNGRLSAPRLRATQSLFDPRQIVAPLSGSGKPLALQTSYGGEKVLILEKGHPRYRFARKFPMAIDVADVNDDGLMDVVCAARLPGSIVCWRQLPSPTGELLFAEEQLVEDLADASVVKAIAGEIAGATDLVAGSYERQQLVLLRNLGDARFAEAERLSTVPVRPLAIESVDVNQDGAPDLVVAGSEGIRYFARQGNSFREPSVAITTLDDAKWTNSLPANVTRIDVNSQRVQQQFHSGDDVVRLVAVSANGRLIATASSKNIVRTWDANGKHLSAVDTGSTRICDMTFSRDGSRLCLAKGDDVIVLESKGLNLTHQLRGHQNTVEQLCISNAGDTLLSTSHDLTAKIWSLRDGRMLKNLAGHTSQVMSAAFSHDDRLVATGGEFGTVKVWDVDTGQELLELVDFPYLVRAIKFQSPNELAVWGSGLRPSTATFEGRWRAPR